jgi:short-subunit dehydrogenase
MILREKYGTTALVAGASEGIGAAFAEYLASAGMNLILVARRKEPLDQFAFSLIEKYSVNVDTILLDLAQTTSAASLLESTKDKEINLLVYNVGLSYIGAFENTNIAHHQEIVHANLMTPMNLIYSYGQSMLTNKKGAVIMMSSLAGFQGSGHLATYAATKAFVRIFGESLWYEWKSKGVDVIACCAGATSSPNFIKTNPEKKSFFAPRVQTPEEVVKECFQHLGKTPSCITGGGNRFATFIMQRLLPRKMAIEIMGDETRKMYRL